MQLISLPGAINASTLSWAHREIQEIHTWEWGQKLSGIALEFHWTIPQTVQGIEYKRINYLMFSVMRIRTQTVRAIEYMLTYKWFNFLFALISATVVWRYLIRQDNNSLHSNCRPTKSQRRGCYFQLAPPWELQNRFKPCTWRLKKLFFSHLRTETCSKTCNTRWRGR